MNDLDSQIKSLKSKVEEAHRTKAKADLQRDQARQARDRLAGRLKAEFGVNSLSEAHELLRDYDTDLQNKTTQIRQELSSFEVTD